MQHAARIKAITFFKADGGVNALKFSALTHKNAFFYRIFVIAVQDTAICHLIRTKDYRVTPDNDNLLREKQIFSIKLEIFDTIKLLCVILENVLPLNGMAFLRFNKEGVEHEKIQVFSQLQ